MQLSTRRCAGASALALAFVFGSAAPARAACPLVVDPGGSGTHTSIQAAVEAFKAAEGNLGPCTIQVRAGLYTDSVEILGANTGATSDAQSLQILADAGARMQPGSHHAFLLRASRFVTIRGFEITGASNEPFALDGGKSANRDITLDSNRVVSNGGGRDSGCITVNAGNTNVWAINNLCRDNGAVGIHFGAGGPNFAVNNLVVRQRKHALVADAGANLVIANNLILYNGADGGAQYGIALGVKAGTASQVRLLHNLLYQNKSGDILNASSAVQNVGNILTPALGSLTLSSFFVDFEAGDLHSAPGSPAIDAGTSTTSTTPERVPPFDFERDPRSAPVDIGPDEVSDRDHDGVPDLGDNCPPGLNSSFNPVQQDRDGDGIGDYCDNCPQDPNPGQEDANGNSRGDACEDIAESLVTCPAGPLESCVLVANFAALENLQTIRPDCLNTYFYCEDSAGRQMPRSDLLPPPRGVPNDVRTYPTGAGVSVACEFGSHFPVNAFAPGEYTCKACYANDTQDPDIDASGTCTSPLGCQDLFQGITCSAPVTVTADPTVSAEACSPGYWKNNADKAGATQWSLTGYAPGDGFDQAFGITLLGPSVTLLQALNLAGGDLDALARHASAALLSASHPQIDYPLSVEAVRVMMQTGDRSELLQRFSTLSGLTCPLPQVGG